MELKNIHTAYFIGIGGIGMSALARWFNWHGVNVYGYDKTPSPLTHLLEEEGIKVHYEDSIEHIPPKIKEKVDGTLVIYTPAIPADHIEYNFLKINGYEVVKRSKALGIITENYFTIAVAGTHGKTTTSCMVAHMLMEQGKSVMAFLGGIPANYKTNFIHNIKEGEKPVVVVEADEFDRSFLTLQPDIAIITSADADHLDVYGAPDALQSSFKEFASKLSNNGKLIIHESAQKELNIQGPFEVATYGFKSKGAVGIACSDPKADAGTFVFDFYGDKNMEEIKLPMPGYHNVLNCTAAIEAVLKLDLDTEAIKKSIARFKGVVRRFELVYERDGLVFIDDYAHHPTEIEALVQSLRLLHKGRKITLVFQPHLFSRTRDFAKGFSEALSLADEVLLMDIYPAREAAIPGVTSAMLMDGIRCDKQLVKRFDLLETLSKKQLEVLATVGAGDIDRMVEPIKETLEKKP